MMIEKLKKYGQDFVASKLESLTGEARAKLEKQLSEIDFDELDELIRDYVLKKPVTEIPSDLAPAPFFPFPAKDDAQKEYYEKARKEGERLLSEGKVAMLVVARRPGDKTRIRRTQRDLPDYSGQTQNAVSVFRGDHQARIGKIRQTASLVHHDQRTERQTHTRILQREQLFRTRRKEYHILYPGNHARHLL